MGITPTNELYDFNIIEVISTFLAALNLIVIFFLAQQVRIVDRSYKDEHERARKEKAIDLIFKWTQQNTSKNKTAFDFIEHLNDVENIENLLDQKPFKVFRNHYHRLQAALLGTDMNVAELKDSDIEIEVTDEMSTYLRQIIINRLNFLEGVFCAAETHVADQDIINSQFGNIAVPQKYVKTPLELLMNVSGEKSFPFLSKFIRNELNRRRNINEQSKPSKSKTGV